VNPAPKHAITAIVAGLLGYAGVGVAAIFSGIHGNRHKLGFLAGFPCRLNEGSRSWREVETVRRDELFGVQHVLYKVIVRVQKLACYRPRPLRLFEYGGRRPESDVEVVQRAAADSRTLDDVDSFEDFVFEESIGAAGLPPGLRYLTYRPREIQAIPLLAALEYADRAAALGQPASGNGAAESGAYNNDVV
jgi:hypothetical protein